MIAQDRVSLTYQTVVKLYNDAQYEKVISMFLSSIHDSSDTKTLFYFGMSYAMLNDIANARKYLLKVIEKDSINMNYRFQYSKVLINNGYKDEGIDHIKFIIRYDTTYISAFYQYAIILYEQKKYEEAISQFRFVIASRPRDFLSYYYTGNSFLYIGQKDSAQVYLTLSLSFNPYYLPTLTRLGTLYFSNNEYSEAMRLYTLAADKTNDADLHYKIGLCQLRLEKLPEAIYSINKAIQADSSNELYYAQLGYIYFQLEKYDSSALFYKQATVINNEEPTYYIGLAIAFSKQGMFQQALESFQQAVVSSHPEKISSIYMQMGATLYQNKKYSDAIEVYKKALEYNPKENDALYYLALSYDQAKQYISAKKWYKKYIALYRNTDENEKVIYAKKRSVEIQPIKK